MVFRVADQILPLMLEYCSLAVLATVPALLDALGKRLRCFTGCTLSMDLLPAKDERASSEELFLEDPAPGEENQGVCLLFRLILAC